MTKNLKNGLNVDLSNYCIETKLSLPNDAPQELTKSLVGNLISVSFEEWGSIPQDFNVQPIWSKDEALVVLEMYVGRKAIGANCELELMILTLTPVFAMGIGEGYDYALAWNVCPIFRD